MALLCQPWHSLFPEQTDSACSSEPRLQTLISCLACHIYVSNQRLPHSNIINTGDPHIVNYLWAAINSSYVVNSSYGVQAFFSELKFLLCIIRIKILTPIRRINNSYHITFIFIFVKLNMYLIF